MKQHIKQLFDLAAQYPESEQEAVIDASEYSDEVKQKVKRLLQIDVNQVELTGTIIDSVHIGLDIKPIEAGMKIDSYVLTQPLGHGGQGEVWRAIRDEGDFSHQVAVKFLKPMHDEKELQRFRNEREVLAHLKHNNIAQLIGGGELLGDSNSPRPYMILELVEGLPLLEYCKKHHFKLKQYLKIFLQICDAISYAHSHLVVHRDIKPNNIIVTDEGVVKLLDFGIAKMLESNTEDTQTVPIMTLAYSSPEQVTGAPISTATDIYILGLLLYEMLTGQRAQAVSTEVPSELIHEITEKIPTSPSQVKVLPQLNRNYSNKHLKGDLDNLIMMAIRKEPNRRYGTVSALASDVKNYLDDKPLLAMGDSSWYKLRKLLSRNPTVTLLSAAVLCFLIILPVVMYNSQQQISQQRDLEIAARKEAQQQSDIANRTKDFLINILKSASPLANKGEDISLNDVLAQSERQLEHGLNDQPILKAELFNTLSSIQHHLGDSQKALDYYQKSLPLYQQEQNIKGQVITLGQMAVISFLSNQPDKARDYAQRAEQLSQQLSDPVEIAWHHSKMATLQASLGKKEQARTRLTAALHVLKQENTEDHELLGRVYNELSISTKDQQEALQQIEQALYHAEQDTGKFHPKYFTRLVTKATKLNRLNRTAEAEDTFLLAKDISTKLYKNEHPRTAILFGELAILYHDSGRFSKAKESYEAAVSLNKKYYGVENLSYVLAINNLAYLYEDMGELKQAEQFFRESLALRQKYYADNPYRVASNQSNLARLLAKTNRHQESQQILNRIMPVFQSNKKNTLALEIIELANIIGTHADAQSCQQAQHKIDQLLPEVNKTSEKSWRRLYNELWIGQLSQKCGFKDLAEELLLAAKNRATDIYAPDSAGLKRVHHLVESALH
ncbi:serine/threonine-protein kinase [Marinicella rhabdoformis]|uniref:serine/threonine-protein kinase n=1 Tax=Marinicella rhabdoformis TaxID=2580566 RepID=UPI0012AED15E|nr:serine/threonine-protein kinase [Marinicella rhabdoformis]